MKFKKLEIHNINSIADAAIDFERLMPEGQHIFMIWGPSGAGKSTILDAICMTLFCKTPRLQSIAEKKENQYADPEFQFSDKSKGIAINDLRQYLKRGTKEGWCSLQFVGNDSVAYTAKTAFSINRNGNLNSKEWSLTSENGVWTKDRDIESQIVAVTGLNYDQFCRTTMLAQGEFTKFMKSDQNAKAEILEKLTDTSIFSEIGKRIYEKFKEQEKSYEQIERENENVARLSAEQIADYQLDISKTVAEANLIEEELKELNAKSSWIKQLFQYQEDVAKSEKNWKAAEETLRSDKNRQLQQNILQWEQTENERKSYLERQELLRSRQSLRNDEAVYQRQYLEVTAGVLDVREKLVKVAADMEKIDDALRKQSYKEETFLQAPVLVEKLRQLARSREEQGRKSVRIAQNNAKVVEIEKNIELSKSKIDKFTGEITQNQQVLDELNEQAKQYDFQKLVEEQTLQKDRARDLENVKNSVQQLKRQQDEINLMKQSVSELQQKQQFLSEQLSQKQALYAQAQEAQETAQKCYEASAQSVNQFAKQMRAMLQTGDTCPVCGQKVERLLTNEAVERSVALLKSQLDASKRAVNDAKKAVDETVTAQTAAEAMLAVQQTELQNKNLVKKNALAALTEICSRLQIEVSETILEQIDKQNVEVEKALQETARRIQLAQEISKKSKAASATLEELKKQVEKLMLSQHNDEVQHTNLKTENGALQQQMAEFAEISQSLESELSGFLNAVYPGWEKDIAKTVQTLTKEAESYAGLQKSRSDQQDLQMQMQREVDQIGLYERKVKGLFEWTAAEKGAKCDGLAGKWMDLAEKCAVLSQKSADLAVRMSQVDSVLSDFYTRQSEISEVLLSQLAATTAEEIARLRGQLQNVQEQERTAHGKLQQAQETMRKHLETRPAMEDGEQLDEIERQIKEKGAIKTEKMQRVGQIRLILQQDADNKQRYADTLAKLDALRQQVRQWERLNNVFGDSTGRTFRRIAQSFILQKLLDNTNYFLSMLSDRYELTGAGRELMILVKDKYLGDAPRPVEMVSGGESFLISIALALGLSNLAMQGITSDFLFIDEGISQLDGTLCDSVVNTLQQLHHIVHCNIGIISHLDVLADKIPTKIIVQPVSHGTSAITFS